MVNLPDVVPNVPTTPTTGSPQTIALPDGSVVQPTPETGASIHLPATARESVYPVLTIPRYDDYPTVPPKEVEWSLMPVTTQFEL